MTITQIERVHVGWFLSVLSASFKLRGLPLCRMPGIIMFSACKSFAWPFNGTSLIPG